MKTEKKKKKKTINKKEIKKENDYKKLSEEYLLGWKRCKADFENYKKRKEAEKKNDLNYAKESFILQILPVLDNFSASTEHIPQEAQDNSWVEGIMYIKKQLEDILRENGLEEISLKEGDIFDENICEAIESENVSKKTKDKKEKEKQVLKIKKVLVKGYRMGDRVIRPAKVIVY